MTNIQIGSTCSSKFQDICRKIKFMPAIPPNPKSIQMFDPLKDKTKGNEFTFRLLDGKPGIYYYDGRFLVYSYTIVYYTHYKGKENWLYTIMCRTCYLSAGKELRNRLLAYVNFMDGFPIEENSSIALKGSAFVRNAVSQIPRHNEYWDSLKSYVESVRNKASQMGLCI